MEDKMLKRTNPASTNRLSATITALVILCVVIITAFSQGVFAWTNTTFNNSLSSESVEAFGLESFTRYLDVPTGNEYFTTANITLNGTDAWFSTHLFGLSRPDTFIENVRAVHGNATDIWFLDHNSSGSGVVNATLWHYNSTLDYQSNFTVDSFSISSPLVSSLVATKDGKIVTGGANSPTFRIFYTNGTQITQFSGSTHQRADSMGYDSTNNLIYTIDAQFGYVMRVINVSSNSIISQGNCGGVKDFVTLEGAVFYDYVLYFNDTLWVSDETDRNLFHEYNYSSKYCTGTFWQINRTGLNYTFVSFGTTDDISGFDDERIYIVPNAQLLIHPTNYNTYTTSSPYDITIGINSVNDFADAGEFNQTGNVTSFLNSLNAYLSSCTYTGGFCSVPFDFDFNGGILTFFDMFFNNDGFTEHTQTFLNETWERSLETFEINITFDSSRYTTVNPTLVYNGTSYAGSTSDTGNNRIYSATINVPEVDVDTNFSFHWEFDMYDGSSTTYTSQSYNQTVKNISIDDCSSYSNLVYNFTVRDEADRDILVGGSDNVTIEVDLQISAFGTTDEFIDFSQTFSYTNPATICLSDTLNSTQYRVDLVVGYSALDYVQEFYFADNETLQNSSMPQHIDLHDLLAVDSTSFLFTFIDTDGLEVDDAIVHVDRKYIGEGVFREVERAKSDDSGETHVHLVEEDVIYRFRITKNDELLYTSSDYQAKCLSTPCEIELRAVGDYFDYDEDEWDNMDGGSYTITKDDSNRQISLTFTSDPTAYLNMNLTAFKYDDNGREVVASNVLNATSGIVTITIPQSFGNVSYVYAVYKDDELVVWGWFDLVQKGVDFFGNTLGVLLTAFMILTIGLIAVTEGVAVVVFVILGLILAGALRLVDLGWIALICLIGAGAILMWKLTKRRVG